MQTIPTPYKIAIIGGIGSGKSVVSRLLTTMGIPVYDCDSRAKRLMNESPILRSALIEVVGAAVYSADGHINRPYLANYMFGHPERVTQINHIVHPTVRADFEAWANSSASPLVAVETAILYESGMDADVDAIVLVHAPMEVRLQRAMQRDHADEPSIRHRMSHQMTDNELLQRATYIIHNDERHSLIAQVQQLIATLTEQNS